MASPGEKFRHYFELDQNELAVLFSLQKQLTEEDIRSSDTKIKPFKKQWLEYWLESIAGKMKGKTIRGPGWVASEAPYTPEGALRNLMDFDKSKRSIILFEALLFTPYFNLNIREQQKKKADEVFGEESRKAWRNRLVDVADQVEISSVNLKIAETSYVEALNDIAGNPRWKQLGVVLLATVGLAVTTGVLAPVIGGLIGTFMGLSGAAATSAGLAFLGGGAIAAGGMGMAGGTAILIGGGALFGGLGSALFLPNFFSQPEVVLSQLAKLDSVLKHLLNKEDHYEELLQIAMDGHAIVRRKLVTEEERLRSQLENQHDEKKRKDSESYLNSIRKIIGYYKVAIGRINGMLLELKLGK